MPSRLDRARPPHSLGTGCLCEVENYSIASAFRNSDRSGLTFGRITLVEKQSFERIVPIEAEPPVIGLLMHEVCAGGSGFRGWRTSPSNKACGTQPHQQTNWLWNLARGIGFDSLSEVGY